MAAAKKKTAKKPANITVPKNYVPSDEEKFMNPIMREYFRLKLVAWKADIDRQTLDTMENLKGESVSHPDPADTAAANANRQLELRTRDRLRKLGNKVAKTLRSVDDGTYGYCTETGDPIRVGRLEARPVATLSIEAQEMHERGERTRAG